MWGRATPPGPGKSGIITRLPEEPPEPRRSHSWFLSSVRRSPHPSLPVSGASPGSESTRSAASSVVTTCCEFAGFASASLSGSSRRVCPAARREAAVCRSFDLFMLEEAGGRLNPALTSALRPPAWTARESIPSLRIHGLQGGLSAGTAGKTSSAAPPPPTRRTQG